MKVIIQDVETGEYLSADGSWRSAITAARDFLTLLRAYHFGQEKTARNFQVILYCPDDNYSASIVTGIGAANVEAAANAKALRVPVEIKSAANDAWTPSVSVVQPRNLRFRVNRMDAARFHLN